MKQVLIPHIFSLFLLITLMNGCGEKTNTAELQAFASVYKNFDNFNYTDSTARRLDSVVSLYPGMGFTDKFNYYNFQCGYYHVAKHDDTKALSYSDSLLMLVNTQKNNPENNLTKLAVANLARGSVLFSLKKYNSALQFFYRGKIAAENSHDAAIKSDLYYNMGMVMFTKLEYNQAARFFIQAFEETKNDTPFVFSKFYRLQEVLNNVSESYVMANKPDSALLYSRAANLFIDRNRKLYPGKEQLIEVAKAVINGTAGQAYLLKKDAANGIGLLQKSIVVNSRQGYDNGDAIDRQISLARFYLDSSFDKDNPAKAAAILKTIGAGLDTIFNEEYKEQWNYLMSRYYDEKRNQPMALFYLKKSIEYDKKNDAENKALSETNVGTYFQVMQNQYEMELLKKNNDIERIYLIIAVILFVLCSSIILLVWRYWHHSKKHVAALTQLNKEISRQKIELEQTLSALNKRSEEKDHILKVIAHDLRNPISAIYALSRLLKSDLVLDAEQSKYADLIGDASTESLELIDSIMQIESGNHPQEMSRQMQNINEIILSCVNQLKAAVAEKNQTVTVELPPEPPIAFVDIDKMQRVIKNLLTNAIKFSHKGTAIHINVKQKETSILIKIEDEGIGIPACLQHKVFDTFTEAKRKGTEDEKTFGLGLSICKQFVEAHGGKIWFHSKENQGTSFYVELPGETASQPVSGYKKAYS